MQLMRNKKIGRAALLLMVFTPSLHAADVSSAPSTWDLIQFESSAEYHEAKARDFIAKYKALAAERKLGTVDSGGELGQGLNEKALLDILNKYGYTPTAEEISTNKGFGKSGALTEENKPTGSAKEMPDFSWALVYVGSFKGKSYADLKSASSKKRVYQGELLDGWKIVISKIGQVTAKHGNVELKL